MKSLVTIALVLASTTAVAAPVVDATATQRVLYQDLDLRTDQGQTALKHRVSRAASSVCRTLSAQETLRLEAFSYCRNVAMRSAKPQLELAFNRARHGEVQMSANSASGGIVVAAAR